MRISHNQIKKLRQCPQRWTFEYVYKRRMPESFPSNSQIIGTLFHKIAELYLKECMVFREGLMGGHDLSTPDLMFEAYRSVSDELYNKYAPVTSEQVTAIEDARATAFSMWTYYLPRCEWFTDTYRCISVPDAPRLVQWNGWDIEYRPDAEVERQVGYPVRFLLDFKTTANIPKHTGYGADFQLRMYAALANMSSGDNYNIAYVFFRSVLPKPPELSVKGMPLTGRSGYDTTWEYWSSEVAKLGFNPDNYRDDMQVKCKAETDYHVSWTEHLTPDDHNWAMTQLSNYQHAALVAQVNPAMANDQDICGYCSYNPVCAHMRKHNMPKPNDFLFDIYGIPLDNTK